MKGKTAAGIHPNEGVAAADPRLLPIGTLVRVDDAGPYSGEYVITDTGRKIHGRHIDLFISNPVEAKHFGKKRVRVAIVQRGDGHAAEARTEAATVAAPSR